MKVSVIIPVYNTASYLGECIDSVLEQTIHDLEVICVNDGSTDNSINIMSKYAQDDSRVKIFSLAQNHGLPFARNYGLDIAQGEYISFLDSDDMFADKHALEILYTQSKKQELDLLMFDGLFMYDEDDISLKKCDSTRKIALSNKYYGIYDGENAFKMFMENGDFIPSVCFSLFKREFLINKHLIFNDKMTNHEDLLFMFQVFLDCKRMKHLSKKFYIYRRHQNSSTTEVVTPKWLLSIGICYLEAMKFVSMRDCPIDLLAVLTNYFDDIKQKFQVVYVKLIKMGIDANKLLEYFSVHEQLKLRLLLYSRHILMLEEYQEIISHRGVIIYGAGKIGREVSSLLEIYGIHDYYIAETRTSESTKYINGKEVLSLNELKYLAPDSIVLLAATWTHHADMIKEMHQLGFNNYINMCC